MLVTQKRAMWFSKIPWFSGGSTLILLWSLGGLVLSLSYSTSLLASLVAVNLEPPIDTFDSLVKLLDAKGGELWNVEVLDNI